MAKDPDPFEFIENQQEHTETTNCSKCGTPYSATNKSRSVAKGQATSQANNCARKDIVEELERKEAERKEAERQEAERKATEQKKK